MYEDEDSLTAKEARQKREATRAELFRAWDHGGRLRAGIHREQEETPDSAERDWNGSDARGEDAWDRIHRHDAPAGAKACQCTKTIGTDWEKDEGDHRKATKEDLWQELRAYMRGRDEPRKAQEHDLEREDQRTATERLGDLHRRMVMMKVDATDTRAMLRSWMGVSPYDESPGVLSSEGILSSLERTVGDLETILDDIQALIGADD